MCARAGPLNLRAGRRLRAAAGARDSSAEPETVAALARFRQPGVPSVHDHGRRRPRPTPHQLPDAHRAEAEAALEVLLDRALDPIVDMVCTARDGALRGAGPRRQGHLPPHRRRVLRAHRGRRAATRSPTSRPPSSRRSPTSAPTPSPTAPRTPTRTRSTRSPSSSTPRPRPTSACSTPPRTTGRTRAVTSASTARSASCRRGRRSCSAGKGVRKLGLVPTSARLVDVAPTICALLGCAPLDDDTAGRRWPFLAVQDGHALTDLLDPTSGRATSSASCSTAPTPTCSTTWPRAAKRPNVARLIEMGVAFGHGAMASLPTVTLANHTSIITGAHPGPPRHPAQRVVRPRRRASR